MSWRNRPKFKNNWPNDVDVILFIDETGDSKYKGIEKSNNKFFTITGCAFKKDGYKETAEKIVSLKKKYWKDGLYNYKGKIKRVCFHSYEIRRGKDAFSSSEIDRNNFLADLSNFMLDLPIKIFAFTIDKEKMLRRYSDPFNPYSLTMDFILERFAKYYLKGNEKGIIILEARGKKQDKELLTHIKSIIDNGTRYADKELFKKIKGVYFNEKWCKGEDCKKSYFGLEISDLIAYPIYKYNSSGIKDRAFECIEDKIDGFPSYNGKGIKKFP